MPLLITIAISVVGWFLIIILSRIKPKQVPHGFTAAQLQKEYVDDANSLFKNALIYIIGFAIGYFIKYEIVAYVIGALGALGALFPTISSVSMLFRKLDLKLSLAAIISEGIPLFISIYLILIKL